SFDGTTGNGQFTLSFNGNSTPLQTTGVSAAALQAAIGALPGIGGLNVKVTRQQLSTPVAGSPQPIFTQLIYTIVFQGALLGANLPQLVLTTINGAIGVISTVADGGVGALVQDGGALAVDLASSPNGQVVNGVALQLNGRGPTGTG